MVIVIVLVVDAVVVVEMSLQPEWNCDSSCGGSHCINSRRSRNCCDCFYHQKFVIIVVVIINAVVVVVIVIVLIVVE